MRLPRQTLRQLAGVDNRRDCPVFSGEQPVVKPAAPPEPDAAAVARDRRRQKQHLRQNAGRRGRELRTRFEKPELRPDKLACRIDDPDKLILFLLRVVTRKV